jgi:hypothetical protein
VSEPRHTQDLSLLHVLLSKQPRGFHRERVVLCRIQFTDVITPRGQQTFAELYAEVSGRIRQPSDRQALIASPLFLRVWKPDIDCLLVYTQSAASLDGLSRNVAAGSPVLR